MTFSTQAVGGGTRLSAAKLGGKSYILTVESSPMRLDNTTVVVTGASAGLGRAMAEALLAAGADVVCVAENEAELRTAVSELRASSGDASADGDPGEALAVTADVREWDAVASMVETVEERLGTIDVLVNNAGVQQRTAGNDERAPVADVPVDIWKSVVATNLTGAFHCAKAALPGMLERDSGRLIHVSSGAGTSAKPNRSPYVASKHGLEGLAKCLALELQESGVESLVFRPPRGGVYTESRSYRNPESYEYESADVVGEPMVQLAGGAGEHGRRYVGTADGTGVEEAD